MTKKVFFLAGLQRSGATLLSSIINQNKNVLATPASPLFHLMSRMEDSVKFPENIDYDKTDAIARSITYAVQAFYADSVAQNIIDKNLNWATPHGLELIVKYIDPDPKIICCVRSIIEILSSFDTIINSVKGNENNLIDKLVLENTLPIKTMADRRADFLMRYDQDIPRCLEGMSAIYNSQYKNSILFIEYDDLVNDPKTEIGKVYKFCNIEPVEHEYQNIFDPSGLSENSLTGIKHLHKVRPKIEKVSVPPERILSRDTIQKYSHLEFWRN